MKEKMNNKGFSLVELIIVIAIMAILVGVLAPQFIKYVERSRMSTDMQNVESYKTALEAYIADSGDMTSATITVSGGATGSITAAPSTALDGVAASTALKSKTWPSATYSYSATGWNSQACANTANTSYDIGSIFH